MFVARIFDWIAEIVWKPMDMIIKSKFLKWYEDKIWSLLKEYWYITIPVLFTGFYLVVMIKIFSGV